MWGNKSPTPPVLRPRGRGIKPPEIKKGVNLQNLIFDLRQLNPGQYSCPYHFHKYGEELFMIISGSATLITPAGLEIVENGDLTFFETGETGAH
jgi:uncharacterized cupin superfamily protein